MVMILFILVLAMGGGANAAPPDIAQSSTLLWKMGKGYRAPAAPKQALAGSEISLSPRSLGGIESVPTTTGAESLILVRSAQLPLARLLEDFQERVSGIESEIVTLEAIASTEPLLDEAALPRGYKNGPPAFLKNYDYALARQVMYFLRARMSFTSRTRFVTLIGTATELPPSYYVSIPHGDGGVAWAATDQCYGARNECLEPRLSVGRLPFSKLSDMAVYLGKVERGLTARVERDLTFLGGKAFQQEKFLVGELAALGLMSGFGKNWPVVDKLFRSNFKYKKEALEALFSGRLSTRVAFHFDHGTGNGIRAEEAILTAREIQSLMTEGEVLPIVLTPACASAAFDEALSAEPVLGLLSHGTVSVGASALKSRAGASAFVGATRWTVGEPTYGLDARGNLDPGEGTYSLKYFSGVARSLMSGTEKRLGEHLIGSARALLVNSQDPLTRWTFWVTELLGDPTLPVTKLESANEASPAPHSLTQFPDQSEVIPAWREKAENAIKIDGESMMEGTLFRVEPGNSERPATETMLAKQVSVGSSLFYIPEVDRTTKGTYLLRVENRFGAPIEKQIWFEVR